MVFKTNITYRTQVETTTNTAFKNKIRAWQTQLLSQLTQTPGKVKRPIRWTSERQRRAFFATKGFGKGIPSKRNNKVAEWDVFVNYDGIDDIRSFSDFLTAVLADINPKSTQKELKADPNGVLINISNPAPYQRYVTGVDQQQFHKDTGWIYAPDIISDGIQDLDGIVSGGII